jgi:glycosyltransferase involved in cell wall biosynthesis
VPLNDTFKWYKKYIGKGKVPASGFVNESNSVVQKMARFVRGNFYFPDPRGNWTTKAIAVATDLIVRDGYTNIITAGPPHSTHRIGKEIKQQFPFINWIADFHDAWTDIWFYDKLYKTPIAKWIDSSMEKSILQKADYIVTVGNDLRQVLSQKIEGKKSTKFITVSMGYDDTIDFSPLENDSDILTICYTGTIDRAYEPWVIIDAVKSLADEGFAVELLFIGITEGEIKAYVDSEQAQSVVRFIYYVTHHESVAYLRKTDALLLVSPKVKSERLIIPGKLYEYLAAQKPIINVGDKNSNTAKIISECQAGINVDRDEYNELVVFLRNWLTKRKMDKSFKPIVSNEKITQYSRRNEAEKIERILAKY